ncbi:MAG: HEPN domain-containing protein [Magnetococcales bacterium]|nr:HEPN domain-containing protein [Magnetococcales bacterium]
MPSDKRIHGTPAVWLSRARGDLALAKTSLPEDGYYEDLCFHAQQAAEKALKAVYLHQGLVFRYTHDLDALLAGLLQQGVAIPQAVRESAFLTLFAWETRYPGLGSPVSLDEYQEAVRKAEVVVAWAEQVLAS